MVEGSEGGFFWQPRQQRAVAWLIREEEREVDRLVWALSYPDDGGPSESQDVVLGS